MVRGVKLFDQFELQSSNAGAGARVHMNLTLCQRNQSQATAVYCTWGTPRGLPNDAVRPVAGRRVASRCEANVQAVLGARDQAALARAAAVHLHGPVSELKCGARLRGCTLSTISSSCSIGPSVALHARRQRGNRLATICTSWELGSLSAWSPLATSTAQVQHVSSTAQPGGAIHQLLAINGTWKGLQGGSYWHQDGQFWQAPKQNIFSVLHAQALPPAGGGTGFADLRAARSTLSQPLLERAARASIRASLIKILPNPGVSFRGPTAEDIARMPEAEHPMLSRRCLDGGPLLYVGSKYMDVVGLETAEAGKALLSKYAWDVGDILVWDNTQVLHRPFPYDNDGTNVRKLYRTQAWMLPVAEPRGKQEL
ncbi:hypothetical protein EMIHUDRAFT_242423 [Emiliania huxleyi CCMP1516]|uniref:TauD/TfdA-like domain-containing protein n=2 Tax=Emiliania huxleyi TaxID=2903 RepID=A0A0D3J9F1_EMIH1|nr:hypothetical protein EMIHUDRAFT_242423 [Emiliania huxleyi CCMP1516]EOD20136.1 hypothetical protein EMIHUDRAFT_242423 [Emiliania huxleyi CCMP1516]|eukprot:XP_005772565.1 hypothetical protein EMIHUDRAFT_242423 [Emiliania huxleyi CCMP1516]